MGKTSARNIISEKLVFEKTGKSMDEWFNYLDKSGAKKKSHSDIYALVSKTDGLNGLGQWNMNLFTTTYEWNRALKERGQREDGFEKSVSETISAPVNKVYKMWIDPKRYDKWIHGKKFSIRKSTENKSVILDWDDDTLVRVEIYDKGPDKCQVVVQHMKIPDSKTAEALRNFWSNTLIDLKQLVEDSAG